MTPEELDNVAKTIKDLAPTIILILGGVTFFAVEVINAIRGKELIVVSLFKGLTDTIIAILHELKGPDWKTQLNALVCIIFGLCVIFMLFWFFRTIFVDFKQVLISLFATWIFGFWFFSSFHTSIAVLSGYRK